MFKRYRIRDFDFKLVLMIFALSAIGVITIGSAEESLLTRQLAGVVAGAFLMIIISLFDYTWIISLSWLIYVVNLVLLVAVWQFGEETKGATRWLEIGGLKFQPSETAKIMLILLFAQFIMKHRKKLNTVGIIACCVGIYAVPWFLVWKQPDLSTSMVLLAIFCVIMFAGGISLKLVFAVLAVVIPAVALVISLALQPDNDLLTGSQRNRILAFVNPEEYSTTYAYQQLNSVTAIASGQLEGKGYKNNEITSVKNGNFIAEPQTDFIFAIIGEELGFIGSCIVIALLLLIVIQCILIGTRSQNLTGKIVCCGFGGLIGIQSFINIGVATQILPNTGVPLPFVSYGLTSLVSLYMGVGFVLNVGLQPKKYQ